MAGVGVAVWGVLWLQAGIEAKFIQAAEGIAIPSDGDVGRWREKGEQHSIVVDLLSFRPNWAKGLAEIERKLGCFADRIDVRVTFSEWADDKAAYGGGERGKGTVRFNMRVLSEYQKKLEDFDKLRRQKNVKVYVPPTQIERVVWHELTHLFQDKLDSPEWFREGMCCFVEQNDSHLRWFAYHGREVRRLDLSVSSEDAYARGWLFWMWLEEVHGEEAVHQLVRRACREGQPFRRALEVVTGSKWEEVIRLEDEWSRAYISKLRGKMGL